ncbi:MAG: SDR family oxidoreductase [Gammaproteobacteria bacterium]|nr:SDR family oxidoreductase [Gammaproteobacteria bacterium]
MQDKSILITGCSSGIGLSAAKGLQEKGYRVFASARKPQDVDNLKQLGFTDALQLDLDSSESINAAVDTVLEKNHGKLFALFNNAGYQQPGAIEDLSRQALRENFETNLFGTHELTTRIIPVMRRQGYGRIVQNSSILGFITLPYRGAYNATKFAMEGLTDTLRLELVDTNIKVSLIEPGPISGKFRANAYQAFVKNIDKENSVHKEKYIGLERRLTSTGKKAPFTLPPEAVLEKLVHALESDKPKARYRVTKPTLWFAIAKRLLGTRQMDKVLLKVAAGEVKR